jgi:hypothetical protein
LFLFNLSSRDFGQVCSGNNGSDLSEQQGAKSNFGAPRSLFHAMSTKNLVQHGSIHSFQGQGRIESGGGQSVCQSIPISNS